MPLKRLSSIAIATIAALMIGLPAHGQVATGAILGNVTDTTGAVIPGATIVATKCRNSARDDVRRIGPVRAAAAATGQLQG